MADFTVEPELPARLEQMAQMFADHGHTEMAATVTHANEAVAALAAEVERLRAAVRAVADAASRWDAKQYKAAFDALGDAIGYARAPKEGEE